MRNIVPVLIFSLIFLAGCSENKPFVVFSSDPITSSSSGKFEKIFKPEQRIYYAVAVPKGFKDNVIRIQIVKKDEKSEFWGYKQLRSQDYRIQNAHYFIDYITLSQKGYYFFRAYERNNLTKPLVQDEFWIRE